MDYSSFFICVLRGQRSAAVRSSRHGNGHAQSCAFEEASPLMLWEKVCWNAEMLILWATEWKERRSLAFKEMSDYPGQSKCVKLIEAPGLRFPLQVSLTPRAIRLIQTYVSVRQEITQLNPRRPQEMALQFHSLQQLFYTIHWSVEVFKKSHLEWTS